MTEDTERIDRMRRLLRAQGAPSDRSKTLAQYQKELDRIRVYVAKLPEGRARLREALKLYICEATSKWDEKRRFTITTFVQRLLGDAKGRPSGWYALSHGEARKEIERALDALTREGQLRRHRDGMGWEWSVPNILERMARALRM